MPSHGAYSSKAMDAVAGTAGRPPSAAAHGRHDELVAPAAAALDLLTVAELKIPRHADLDVAEPLAAARNRNAFGLELRIGLDESVLDLPGCHGQRRLHLEILWRDFHDRPRLANGFEIGVGGKARAGAVAVPFVKNQ